MEHQLQNNIVDLVLETLLAAQSIDVHQFMMLKDEIEHGTVEAQSNIQYLSILKDPGNELKACTNPANLTQCLPKMMHLFRTIWLNSPYYNTHERINNLFSALSNEIIVKCKDFVDLADVFQGKTRNGIKILTECIELCENYKTMYYQVKLF